jgi:glutamate 5-kinase
MRYNGSLKCYDQKIAVVKVGTGVLADDELRGLDSANLVRITKQIGAVLDKKKCKVVVVSSGAMLIGRQHLFQQKLSWAWPEIISEGVYEKQLLCGVGQPHLATLWHHCMSKYGYPCAQILLNNEDFERENYRLNLRQKILDYLALGVVPVLNEDDVKTDVELKNSFSDNDQAAVLVAMAIEADDLIFLTLEEGLLEEGELVSELVGNEVCQEIQPYMVGDFPIISRGGMTGKLKRCHEGMGAGINVYIANGRNDEVITDILLHGKNPGTFGRGRKTA